MNVHHSSTITSLHMYDYSTARGCLCFDMQGNGILSSHRARASMQPLASFPCYQPPLTHTTDVLAEGSCTTDKSGRHKEKIYKLNIGKLFQANKKWDGLTYQPEWTFLSPTFNTPNHSKPLFLYIGRVILSKTCLWGVNHCWSVSSSQTGLTF